MKLDTLDRVFSEYIRKRDRLQGTEVISCISCSKIVHWKESDCGHFVNRKHMSTRFDEKNCNAQCRACNRYSEGNMSGYVLGLYKKYGENIVELLHVKKQSTYKYSQVEINELVKHYRNKIKELN